MFLVEKEVINKIIEDIYSADAIDEDSAQWALITAQLEPKVETIQSQYYYSLAFASWYIYFNFETASFGASSGVSEMSLGGASISAGDAGFAMSKSTRYLAYNNLIQSGVIMVNKLLNKWVV